MRDFLHIEVRDTRSTRLDEVLTWWDILSHKHTEYCIGFFYIFYRHSEHLALYWIHRRLPELLRIHLTKTLISLDTL